MRNSCVQVSFADTYTDVCDALENNPPKLIHLLESHIIIEDFGGLTTPVLAGHIDTPSKVS